MDHSYPDPYSPEFSMLALNGFRRRPSFMDMPLPPELTDEKAEGYGVGLALQGAYQQSLFKNLVNMTTQNWLRWQDTTSPMLSIPEAEQYMARRRTLQDEPLSYFLKVERPIRESELEWLIDTKIQERNLQYRLSKAQPGMLASALRVGVSVAAMPVVDPLSTAISVIPFLGTWRMAAAVSQAVKVATRQPVVAQAVAQAAVRGGAEGLIGSLITEAPIALQMRSQQADYDATDFMQNIAYGTVFSSIANIVGVGIQAYRKQRNFQMGIPADNGPLLQKQLIENAPWRGAVGARVDGALVNADDIISHSLERPMLPPKELSVEIHDAALRATAAALLDGRPVNADDIISYSLLWPPEGAVTGEQVLETIKRSVHGDVKDILPPRLPLSPELIEQERVASLGISSLIEDLQKKEAGVHPEYPPLAAEEEQSVSPAPLKSKIQTMREVWKKRKTPNAPPPIGPSSSALSTTSKIQTIKDVWKERYAPSPPSPPLAPAVSALDSKIVALEKRYADDPNIAIDKRRFAAEEQDVVDIINILSQCMVDH